MLKTFFQLHSYLLKKKNTHYPSDKYDVEIKEYEDEGFSGGNIDRPHFQEFIKNQKENSYDVLICYRLDRISRNIYKNSTNKLKNY